MLHSGPLPRFTEIHSQMALKLIERHRGIERAMRRAEVFTEKAREIISGISESPYQRALYALTELVTDRDH